MQAATSSRAAEKPEVEEPLRIVQPGSGGRSNGGHRMRCARFGFGAQRRGWRSPRSGRVAGWLGPHGSRGL